MTSPGTPKSIVVLISGRGSNMRSLIEAGLPVVAVISNRHDAAGLQYAQSRNIPTAVIEHGRYATREAFDAALVAEIDKHRPSLVVLAGFMRIFTPAFVARYAGRLVNIHPALLPAFTGLNTHARALAAGVKFHGCTVHWVTPVLDEGPIIIQAAVPVLPTDDENNLAARVLRQEHKIYPLAVRWILDDKVHVVDGRVRVDGNERQYLYADE
ncbi:MAG TPA: phosphoribosylglycinamide formyltransferase [Burkholderiales bacterium]|nr:phosphoribosylglycinamide formyltransferase [Burkholderiales bacterium]